VRRADEDGYRACLSEPPPNDVVVECEVVPAPGGVFIGVLTTTMGQFKRFVVELIRPGNNSVYIQVSNGAGAPFVAQRPSPILTREQAIALAREPALATTLF
jgi:hypothetical protein